MIPVNWRRLWELYRLESRSRRAHLQQAKIQEQEPYLTHSKNSSLLQVSPSPHQDRLIRSRAKPGITEIAKFITDEKELDDLEGKHEDSMQESRSTNRNTQRRIHQPLNDPPPPRHPPRVRTA